MDDLLLPNLSDKNAFAGEILRGLTHSAMYENTYLCTVRPTNPKNNRMPEAGKVAYLVLVSGEAVSIFVTGITMMHPTPEAVSSGEWQPLDTPVYFRAPDLTEEQIKQARTFVQP